MTSLVATYNGLGASWFPVALAIAWQAFVIAGVFALAAAALRRSPPGLRYWLWQLAAIKLLLMPFWWAAIRWPDWPDRGNDARIGRGSADGGLGGGASRDNRARHPDAPGPDMSPGVEARANSGQSTTILWKSWLMSAWSAAVVGQVAAIGFQQRRLTRFLRRTALCEDEGVLDAVAEISGIMRLSRPPQVRTSPAGGSPFVCGMFRPRLVLPDDLASSLGPTPLRSILFHEMAHLARKDLAWDWIPTIVRVLYASHPAACYIAFRARLERELACDRAAMVLSGQDVAGYASTLVEVVGRSSASQAAPPAPHPVVNRPIAGIRS